MTPNEQVEMMKRLVYEIRELRNQIAAYKPKAEAYDLLTAIVNLLPKRSEGQSEDIVWMLEKKIDEILKMRREAALVPEEAQTAKMAV